MLAKAPNEASLGIQIFTGKPSSAAKAAHILHSMNPTVIDVNCGCSVPKVVKSGAGAALLQKPEKIREIVTAIQENTSVPVSLKIRSGWTSASLNFLKISEMAERLGVRWVTLHPRTAVQGFTGEAVWDHIALLKKQSALPVIGSGDLFTPFDAQSMLRETLCDGIMIARGAIGNPFIFDQIRTLLTTGDICGTPTPSQRLHTAMKQLSIAIELKDEKQAILEMRKHFCAYTRGLPYSARFRNQIVKCQSFTDYRDIAAALLYTAQDHENLCS